MILINVDLPAPLSPYGTSTSPASIFRSTSVGACMAPHFLEIPRSSNRRTALLSIGSDDAFLQDQVAVEPALARGDHGEAALYPLVERQALDAFECRHPRFVSAQQRTELVEYRHLAVRVVHHLHVECRARDELVQRHEGENRCGHGRHQRTVG